jgi:hypothetical protein
LLATTGIVATLLAFNLIKAASHQTVFSLSNQFGSLKSSGRYTTQCNNYGAFSPE